MKWKEGRQGSRYFNKLLAQGKTWDCYLLKYPTGSYISLHKDFVDKGLEHHRINFTFWRAKEGGIFFKDTKHSTKRYQYFRPDKVLHGVSKVEEGTRYVLSIGWVKNGNN